MTTIKTLIVDDEQSSRNVLREYLRKYCPAVELVGEAGDVNSALQLIREHKPDLVFLDVEMPGGNGFDLLEQAENIDFETIFVTAFDHYAIQAINYSAASYLLKPVSIDDLVNAVNRFEKLKSQSQLSHNTQVILDNLKAAEAQQKKIVLPLLHGFEVVKIEQIIICEAFDNFTNFYFEKHPKTMICRNLKFYEDLLSDSGFLRVHKSYIINLEHVAKYTRGKGGILTMSNGMEIPVSPQKKDLLLENFERGRKSYRL